MIYIKSRLKGKINSHCESRCSAQTKLPKMGVLGQGSLGNRGKLSDAATVAMGPAAGVP